MANLKTSFQTTSVCSQVGGQSIEFPKQFYQRVVAWFQNHARVLPWRKCTDPYSIWISEIMLQQTQVATVISYFERFIKRFPSVFDLARAKESEVLKMWEGLGYYRRAKNLREGAQLLVKKFGGEFPQSREELLSVPGIGAYSAGSILAIAFQKAEPALDGNLIRVYSRYFGIRDFVDKTKTLKKLWTLAGQAVPESSREVRPFTEGMMEIGALICTPRNPKCLLCPLELGCLSFRRGNPEALPRKSKSVQRIKFIENSFFCFSDSGRIGVMAKGFDLKYPDFHRLPFSFARMPPAKYDLKLKYSVTHRDFSVYVRRMKSPPNAFLAKLKWLSRTQVEKILLPAIDRKILKEML